MPALQRELDYFEKRRGELLAEAQGQFAVIRDHKLLGIYATMEEGFAAGVKAFGLEPFLLREINAPEEVVQLPAVTVGILHARS